MTTLKITGMTCDSCAAHVKDALEKVPGVQSAVVLSLIHIWSLCSARWLASSQ